LYYLSVNTWVRALGSCLLLLQSAQTASRQYKLLIKTSAVHYRGTIGLAVLESK